MKNTNTQADRALRIGLTGGIASGKSTAAAIFASLGADIIDADAFAKSLTQKDHPNVAKIAKQFGHGYLTDSGELDRPALRQLISQNEQANAWLKQLLHPQIFSAIMQQSLASKAPYCILMIPLLAESDNDYQLDRICVVDCPEELQLQRLQQRDTVSAEQAINLVQLQTSRKHRLAIANDIIINDGDYSHLEQQIQQLHQRYLELAKR